MGATPALHPRLAFDRSLTHFGVVRDATRAWPGARAQAEVDRERSRFRDTGAELGLRAPRHRRSLRGRALHWWGSAGRACRLVSLGGSGSLRLERAELHDPGDPFADPPPSDRRHRGRQPRAPAASDRRGHGAARGEALGSHRGRSALERHGRYPTGERRRARAGLVPARRARHARLGARRARQLVRRRARPRLPRAVRQPGKRDRQRRAARPSAPSSWDAGLSWTRTVRGVQAGAEWAHYETHARDLILYTQAGPGRGAPKTWRARASAARSCRCGSRRPAA